MDIWGHIRYFLRLLRVKAATQETQSDPSPGDGQENGEEEELEDQFALLREECTKEEHISKLLDIFNECNDRVNNKTKTAETCEQELIDFVNHRDHCVSKKLFDRLK